MGINFKNFLSSKSRNKRMMEFQDLDHIDGVSISSTSADLYNNPRDDLVMFYFRGLLFADIRLKEKFKLLRYSNNDIGSSNSRIKEIQVKRFKLFFFIPLIYLIIFFGFVITSIGEGEPNPAIFAVIVALYLFSMFCIFHTLHFVAKTLKTVELQREVSFSDFAGEFFMIWFYPIGV